MLLHSLIARPYRHPTSWLQEHLKSSLFVHQFEHTMAATAKTLATFELLEHIFDNLGTMDLIRARQVNVAWADVINCAKVFGERLFVTPSPAGEYLHWARGEKNRLHNLLSVSDVSDQGLQMVPTPQAVVINHPMLDVRLHGGHPGALAQLTLDPKRVIPYLESHWANTFVCQPPRDHAVLQLDFRKPDHQWVDYRCTSRGVADTGVKLEAVFAALERLRALVQAAQERAQQQRARRARRSIKGRRGPEEVEADRPLPEWLADNSEYVTVCCTLPHCVLEVAPRVRELRMMRSRPQA